jgi:hypothetical protein
MYLPMVHQMLSYVTGLAEGGPIRQETAGDSRRPGIEESGDLVYVFNVDPYESDMARCTPKAFADCFGFQLPVAADPGVARQNTPGKADDRLRSNEIWPWLALTLLGLLLAENFLANRTAA